MPYIPQPDRERIDAGVVPKTPGELNYLITTLCLEYLGLEPSYADHNTVIGIVECVKLELYRTQTAVYEDRKRHVNGDVEPHEYTTVRWRAWRRDHPPYPRAGVGDVVYDGRTHRLDPSTTSHDPETCDVCRSKRAGHGPDEMSSNPTAQQRRAILDGLDDKMLFPKDDDPLD